MQADELRLDDLGAGPEGELLKRDVETLGFRVDNRSRVMLSESIGTTFTYGGEFYRDVQDGASASGEREGVDRKSVVSGKSVSVRVDLGGRRIIKKKTKKISTDSQTKREH